MFDKFRRCSRISKQTNLHHKSIDLCIASQLSYCNRLQLCPDYALARRCLCCFSSAPSRVSLLSYETLSPCSSSPPAVFSFSSRFRCRPSRLPVRLLGCALRVQGREIGRRCASTCGVAVSLPEQLEGVVWRGAVRLVSSRR